MNAKITENEPILIVNAHTIADQRAAAYLL